MTTNKPSFVFGSLLVSFSYPTLPSSHGGPTIDSLDSNHRVTSHNVFLWFILFLNHTTAHEYIKVDGDIGTVGISDFAQKSLGDIVFVDLPEVGDEFDKGDSFGSVESVKAASDVYAPISGTVVEINTTLSDDPGVVNAEAEGSAWFIKLQIKDPSELETLMGQDAYEEHCAREAH